MAKATDVAFVDGSWEEMVLLITVFLDSVWPVLEDVWRDASCCLPLIRWRVKRRTRRQRLFDRGGRKRQVLRGAYRELGPKCQDCRGFLGYWRRGGMGNIERSDVLSQLDATVFTTAVQATRTVSYAVIPCNNMKACLGSFNCPSDRCM